MTGAAAAMETPCAARWRLVQITYNGVGAAADDCGRLLLPFSYSYHLRETKTAQATQSPLKSPSQACEAQERATLAPAAEVAKPRQATAAKRKSGREETRSSAAAASVYARRGSIHITAAETLAKR